MWNEYINKTNKIGLLCCDEEQGDIGQIIGPQFSSAK